MTGPPSSFAEPTNIPTSVPTTEVIFLIMRRMRMPLLFVATTFAEAPHPFSYPQRMWLTMSIYLLVISWAYTIAVFFALVQGAPFQAAVAAQQFRRQVRRLVEPFVIVAGYGSAGRIVGAKLDENYRRFVVIDERADTVQSVVSEQLSFNVPAVQGDSGTPAVLGMAGLAHPDCEGVLALTDDDDTNLAVVMTASLLRPDLPVLGRCAQRRTRTRMEHFAPGSAINADDRFGDYLALSIQLPVNHQLLRWLMDNDQEQLRPARRDLAARRWVVCAEGEFGDAVVQDLAAIGVGVDLVDPAGGDPDVSGSVGFIAGTANETLNIAMAEHARQSNPDVYLVVPQETDARKSLLDAMQIESVYIDTEVIAREVLARIVTPVFWSFIENVLTQDEQWAVQVRDHLRDRCGDRTPHRDVITLFARETPAIADWLLQGKALTLRTLMLRPDDRDSTLPLAALVLVRDGEPQFMPPEDTPLALDDQVLLVGKPAGLALVREICHYPATVEYLATGRDIPLTWVWARLTARGRVA